MELNTLELDIAKEIINIGLGKATDSMAFFTKDKVLIRSLDVKIAAVSSVDSFSEKGDEEDLIVLSTTLKGELQGVCHLVFSKEEALKIFKVTFPKSILENPDKMKVMGDAILLEMDNIIAASVITQFSNLLNYATYGGVPRMKKMKKSALNAFVKSDEENLKSCIFFKSDFSTTTIKINPDFIWLMDDKFIQGVKNVAENENMFFNSKRKYN